ncbi:MAG: hypothetical protein HYW49_01720 [Deltaproteobacteria bacterium]|nr:hypothetical protein [Deltaproteobacteria bacterium]
MTQPFVHELPSFKELIEIIADEASIKDPALVEKDYWIMPGSSAPANSGNACGHLQR